MAKLPSGGQAWIGAVIADPRYRGLQQQARNPLVHSRVLRNVSTTERVGIELGHPLGLVRTDALLVMATEFATEHVEGLMVAVPF